jgi:hypothetical protein
MCLGGNALHSISVAQPNDTNLPPHPLYASVFPSYVNLSKFTFIIMLLVLHNADTATDPSLFTNTI